ncbi:hypothetical protein K437DRAFT_259403 [Tilletiaria anomala UBC 951]|uniref:Uncharacterized protein n=1 Tax=Tilletiaria anomala (strain ATCC 24038 / CBS 436.72 / UBC 951) TaxID=1037660 RepID=A0A066VIA1_TILAU|nr:uncharacterized protein K437DRAFT_259403 [Tilletiaria anomala UBC 951]KDN38454.1 hypothetical protein K437DRAFT_259403 [Tilletiaria anomala UBC 951]
MRFTSKEPALGPASVGLCASLLTCISSLGHHVSTTVSVHVGEHRLALPHPNHAQTSPEELRGRVLASSVILPPPGDCTVIREIAASMHLRVIGVGK